MKTIFILLFTIGLLTTTEKIQETETMKATFTEFADGIYYFTDSNDYVNEFEYIKKDILAKYDLLTDEFKGKLFIITYETDAEEDEQGDEIVTSTIIDLELAE